MKIAFFDTKPYDREAFEKENLKYGMEFRFFEAKLNSATAILAKGCECVCIFVNDTASAEVIDLLCAMGVKLLALRCAGINNVDTEYAKGRLEVVNVPAYSPHAVAEHAMAMLLTLVRKTHKAFLRTRDHNFSLVGLTGFDLYGKTVGIVGTGRIGKAFAEICRGFGMKVQAYDKIKSEGIDYVTLDELLESSDIISLHCPLTAENRHMINENTVSKLKHGVILINTSRGGLVDSAVLLENIRSRKIGGACLDVYEEESGLFFEDKSETIMEDDILIRLISMPNVLVTSHQAFLTEEALLSIAETTLRAVSDFGKGAYAFFK